MNLNGPLTASQRLTLLLSKSHLLLSLLLSLFCHHLGMPRSLTRARREGYSVYQRKDGRYGWAVTTGYNEKGHPIRIQGICAKRSEATAAALAAKAKVDTGTHVPTGRDLTLASYLDEWLELYVKPHREPKTYAYYKGMVKHHLKPALGKVHLRKLTGPMFQKLLNSKAQPNEQGRLLSTDTLRGIRATLRSALTRAYKNGLVAENIASRVDTPKTKPVEREYLTAENAAKLIAQCGDHPIDRLILIGLHTGLRIGEVTGLTWADVDFDNATIRIRTQLQRVEKKLVLKALKSQSASRTLCLPETALEALKAQKGYQLLQGSTPLPGTTFNPMNLVFLNVEQRPLDPKFVNDRLRLLMEQAKIKPLSFHKLRHTAATLMLNAGIPLIQVRDQLGHSQIALTANIYGHAVPSALREASNALERAMKPKPSQ